MSVNFGNSIAVSQKHVGKIAKHSSDENILQKNDSAKSTSKKVCLGVGLAALASVGIYLATKGKVKPNNVVKPTLPENLSHVDMDLFKKFGKFEKGKAIFNGKEFTGHIYTKNGTDLIYHKGIIEKSTGSFGEKFYSDGKLRVINHKYRCVGDTKQTVVKYLDDGTRVTTEKLGGYHDKFMDADQYGKYLDDALNHDIITTIKPDGTITRLTKNKTHYNLKLNKNYTYNQLEHLNTGKREVFLNGSEFRDKFYSKNLKRRSVVNGKKLVEEIDKNGNVVKSYTTEFNPKTGISTQNITEQGRRPLLVQRDKNGYVLKKINDDSPLYYLWDSKEFGSGMARHSTANDYLGVSKEKVMEFIQKEGLQFVL